MTSKNIETPFLSLFYYANQTKHLNKKSWEKPLFYSSLSFHKCCRQNHCLLSSCISTKSNTNIKRRNSIILSVHEKYLTYRYCEIKDTPCNYQPLCKRDHYSMCVCLLTQCRIKTSTHALSKKEAKLVIIVITTH